MKAPKFFNVVLFDRQGNEIANSEQQGMKAAKDTARHYLSDEFAKSSETTHAALGTAKVAIFTEGESIGVNRLCEWDKEHPQHAQWVCDEDKRERDRETVACLKQDLQAAELELSKLDPGAPGYGERENEVIRIKGDLTHWESLA